MPPLLLFRPLAFDTALKGFPPTTSSVVVARVDLGDFPTPKILQFRDSRSLLSRSFCGVLCFYFRLPAMIRMFKLDDGKNHVVYLFFGMRYILFLYENYFKYALYKHFRYFFCISIIIRLKYNGILINSKILNKVSHIKWNAILWIWISYFSYFSVLSRNIIMSYSHIRYRNLDRFKI